MTTATKRTIAKNAAPSAKKAVPAKKVAPAVKKAAAPAAKKVAPAKKAGIPVVKKERPVPTKDQYRIYVLRVRRNDPSAKFDYYVGSTKKTLDVKWIQYSTLNEPFLSRWFHSGKVTAVGFVLELMKGWGPYESDDLAKFAEGELALNLQDRGYAVHSDQLKPAIKRRKSTGMVFEVPVWNSRSHKKLAKEAGDIRRAAKKAHAAKKTMSDL